MSALLLVVGIGVYIGGIPCAFETAYQRGSLPFFWPWWVLQWAVRSG